VASTGTFGHIERLVPETLRSDVAEGRRENMRAFGHIGLLVWRTRSGKAEGRRKRKIYKDMWAFGHIGRLDWKASCGVAEGRRTKITNKK